MTVRKDLSSLSGGYALNALDNHERTEFETQLGASQEFRNEVTELIETAVLLGLAVDPVAPSAELKASIMARLASTPQLPRGASQVSTLQPTYRPEAPAAADATADAPAVTKARARWFSWPVAALTAVAAAVGLIVGGGVVANTLVNNGFHLAQANQFAAINASKDFEQAVVQVAGGGTATLVWSLELTSSALIVDGFTSLPSDRVYELWYIGESGARPAGTFSVSESGATWRVLDGDMVAGDMVGVTVEPRGGSEQPTTDPIVAIESA